MNSLRSVSVIFAAVGLAVVVAQADEASAKAGMRQRLGAVDALKTAGKVGEANSGLLAVRDGGGDAQGVVDAENADRSVLFAETAKKTGGTAEAVGKAFARQLAAASQPGVWLQREDGGWYKK